MTAVKAVVVVASNRAADGVYEDTSGPILVKGLASRGFDVSGPVVVHDGEEVAQALLAAAADGADLVVTSGGTGLTRLDLTPEMTSRVVDFEVPGIAEMIRAAGLAKTPHAALSRGIAGVAGRTLIVNLAGSTGAAKDGLAVLTAALVEHAVSQMHDGDHERDDTGSGHVGDSPTSGGVPSPPAHEHDDTADDAGTGHVGDLPTPGSAPPGPVREHDDTADDAGTGDLPGASSAPGHDHGRTAR